MPPSTPPAHCVSCWREEDRGCQEGGFVETSVFGNSDRYSRKRQISFIAKYREKNLDRLKGTRVQLSLLSAQGRIGCLVNAEGVSNWEPGGIDCQRVKYRTAVGRPSKAKRRRLFERVFRPAAMLSGGGRCCRRGVAEGGLPTGCCKTSTATRRVDAGRGRVHIRRRGTATKPEERYKRPSDKRDGDSESRKRGR